MVPISQLCVHWQGEDECPAPDCYRRLPVPAADVAWGLGKFSEWHGPHQKASPLYFGKRVQYLKYSTGDDVSLASRYQIELAEAFRKFVANQLHRYFEICVVVSGNRPNAPLIMERVASDLQAAHIVGRSVRLLKLRPLPVMKFTEPQGRAEVIAGAYAVHPNSGVATAKNILIIDDVYQSGATLNEVAATVRKASPSAFIAAVCATYLRDPKEVMWKQ